MSGLIMSILLKTLRAKNTILGTLSTKRTALAAAKLFTRPRRLPVKSWEVEMENRGRRVAYGSGLSAITWGESERKILLVHGWESRATQVSGFVEDLVKSGYQVIAIDGPAHGQSIGRSANPYMFTKAIHLADEEFGPFAGAIGHSMGGNALATALAEGFECAKTVLISSPSNIENVLMRFADFIGLPSKTKPLFISAVEKEVGKPARALNTSKNIQKSNSEYLIIHDQNDLEIPFSDAEDIASNSDEISLLKTEGFGHRLIIRQPVVWKKVAEFFSSARLHNLDTQRTAA